MLPVTSCARSTAAAPISRISPAAAGARSRLRPRPLAAAARQASLPNAPGRKRTPRASSLALGACSYLPRRLLLARIRTEGDLALGILERAEFFGHAGRNRRTFAAILEAGEIRAITPGEGSAQPLARR